MTLFLVLSKRFPGLVLIQEVPVRLCASFSPAESMSLQFSFLLRLHPNLWVKHLSVKQLDLEDELRSFHCIFRCFSTTKEAPIEIFCLVTLDVRKQQWSFAGVMAKIVYVRWPNTFANSKTAVSGFWYISWHICFIDCIFFCKWEIVISFELTKTHRNCNSWAGAITEFFWFIENSRHWSKKVTVSRRAISLFLSSVNMSTKQIIMRIPILFKRAMGIFRSFVKTLGAGGRPKHRYRNWYRVPSHRNITFSVVLKSGTHNFAS